MATPKCSLSFHRISVDLLASFASNVSSNIFGNAGVFATPPVAQPVFEAQIGTYSTARNAYTNGGSNQKAPYEEAKDTLMDTLDQNAAYVDSVANGDPNVIMLAGYTPTKATGSDVPEPEQPTQVDLSRGSTGVLKAECNVQRYAESYVCLMTEGAPPPSNIMVNAAGQIVMNSGLNPDGTPTTEPTSLVLDLNKSRKKEFMGLTPGTTYYFVFIVINASGVGPMSDVRSIMCV